MFFLISNGSLSYKTPISKLPNGFPLLRLSAIFKIDENDKTFPI